MQTLTNLTATPLDAPYVEPPIHHPLVGISDGAGYIYLRVGPAGIVISNGKSEIAIPIAELLKLHQTHAPPPPAN